MHLVLCAHCLDFQTQFYEQKAIFILFEQLEQIFYKFYLSVNISNINLDTCAPVSYNFFLFWFCV